MNGQTEIMWGDELEVLVADSAPTTWKEVPISEVADFLQGLAINAKTKHLLSTSGLPLLRIKDLLENTHEFYINEVEAPKKTIVSENDLIITRTGQVGYVFMGKKGVLHNNSFRIIPKSSEIYLPFVYWFFNRASSREYLTGISAGSAQPDLTHKIFSEVEIPVPPVAEQRAIVSVLSSLDNKIDLLHRQNATIEALAETLFRQWFVEEAKEDWEEGTLGDAISVKGGTTPSTKEPGLWDGNIRWTTPKDLSNHTSVFLFDTERKITEKGLAKIGSGLLPVGTVLLSSRAPIGYLAITSVPLAINQGYIAILCDKKVSNFFMYLWCKTNLEEIKSNGNGSVFQEISKSVFKELKIIIPSQEVLARFDELIKPSFEKIKNNQIQIQTLSNLRDTLLPKLMSGEVRVAY